MSSGRYEDVGCETRTISRIILVSEMWIGSPGSAPADEVHDPDDMQEPPVQQRLEEQVAAPDGSL